MARLLILAAIAFLGWLAWKKWLAPQTRSPRQSEDYRRMVRCRECGVHLPADESVRRGDADYCCEAHARNQG
ncbi:hypothetical protein PC39_02285 [Salinisphaera sp. PC39]|uniref:PP0621 family protein n=1 Tax=Salinisphaera sp. PC39 TaxID=1304156 RepID=UPI003340BF70